MNFAAVSRIDLLEQLIVDRGAWTEAVRDEVADFSQDLQFADLARVFDFMPQDPHRPSGAELKAAVKIRKGLAKPGDTSGQHWGESEMIAIIESRYQGAALIVFTEDAGVLGQCWRMGVETASTRTVLEACMKKEWITRKEANQLANRMINLDRPVFGFPPIFHQPLPMGMRPNPIQ